MLHLSLSTNNLWIKLLIRSGEAQSTLNILSRHNVHRQWFVPFWNFWPSSLLHSWLQVPRWLSDRQIPRFIANQSHFRSLTKGWGPMINQQLMGFFPICQNFWKKKLESILQGRIPSLICLLCFRTQFDCRIRWPGHLIHKAILVWDICYGD